MVLDKPSKKTVNILGTRYTIYIAHEKTHEFFKEADGVCDHSTKEIYIAICDTDPMSIQDILKYRAKVLRHEIVHAFLYESGLDIETGKYNIGWAINEEMVDWFAIQFHKIEKVYQELEI